MAMKIEDPDAPSEDIALVLGQGDLGLVHEQVDKGYQRA